MYCRYCGKQLDDDMKFCPYCSKSVDGRHETSDPAAVWNNTKEFLVFCGQKIKALWNNPRFKKAFKSSLIIIAVIGLFIFFNSSAWLKIKLTGTPWKEAYYMDSSNEKIEISYSNSDYIEFEKYGKVKFYSRGNEDNARYRDYELFSDKTLYIEDYDKEYFEYGEDWRFEKGYLVIGDYYYD